MKDHDLKKEYIKYKKDYSKKKLNNHYIKKIL